MVVMMWMWMLMILVKMKHDGDDINNDDDDCFDRCWQYTYHPPHLTHAIHLSIYLLYSTLGMIALRREASIIKHEDFMEAINVVAAKKKGSLDYYA